MNIPLNIDWHQILLHMLNLVLLVGILYFLLYKPVKAFMEKRQAEYRAEDARASKALAEAESCKAEYEAKLAAADSEIRAQKAAAEQESAANAAAQMEKAKAEADGLMTRAKVQARQEYDSMIDKANEEIAGMVADAADRLIFTDASQAYETFLGEVESGGEDE